jgi:hypothetical protein
VVDEAEDAVVEEADDEVAKEAEDEVVEEAKVGALKEDEVVEESAAVVVVVVVVIVIIVSVDSWIVVGGRTTMVTRSKPEKTSKMEWRLMEGTQTQNDLAPPPRVDCGDDSGFLENIPILSRICDERCVCVCVSMDSQPRRLCRSTWQILAASSAHISF